MPSPVPFPTQCNFHSLCLLFLIARLMSDWSPKADGSYIEFTQSLFQNITASTLYDFKAKLLSGASHGEW